MTTPDDLQDRIARVLEAQGALPLSHPVIRRKEKDFKNDTDAGMAIQRGLAVFAMPPFPTSAVQGVPFVFYDGYEVRVRLFEIPDLNSTGTDIYSLIDAVPLALHWQPKSVDSPLAGILSHPLMLARRPVEMVEGQAKAPGLDYDGQFIRIADVLFNAVLQVNPEEV